MQSTILVILPPSPPGGGSTPRKIGWGCVPPPSQNPYPIFLLKEHGDPRIFFQVFAKNSLIKKVFEEEKKFGSGTRFFFGK